jgi:two-component system response regulator GlrR
LEAQALMKGKRVLLVDDEEKILELVALLLESQGCIVTTASSGEEAVSLAEEQAFNIIITDMQMPGLSWEALLKKLLSIQPGTPVILLTAYSSVERSLDLIRQGAYDLIQKPHKDKEFLFRVAQALEKEAVTEENRALRSRLREYGPELIVGDQEVMGRLLDQVATVAATEFPVLLTGESGTGKEMVARYIHRKSPRASGTFVAVNCAAVPTELFESEFFGHVRGSFTGAHADRKGLFEEAEGGSIFLDEIGEVSLENQVKLLRVLQENEVRRVGDRQTRKIDARLICATNQDVKSLVRQGRFREDLYYRINVFPVVIPPLRERPGDVPALAQYFIQRARGELARDVVSISRAAISKLSAYSWPGNVRQLENALRQAMVRSTGERIEADDIVLDDDEAVVGAAAASGRAAGSPGEGAGGQAGEGRWPSMSGWTLRDARERATKRYLDQLLTSVAGNVSRAAEIAAKHRSDFYELLNRYNIDLSLYRQGGGKDEPPAS